VGHTYKNCTGTRKKCINCSGLHNTLAMSCPERKKIVNSKRNNIKTFAERVTTRSDRGPSSKTSAVFNQRNYTQPAASELENFHEVIQKTASCLMIASLKENEVEGCFSEVFNTLLSANGLSEFNMSTITPPKFGTLLQAAVADVGGIAKNVLGINAVTENNSIDRVVENRICDISSAVSVDRSVATSASSPVVSIFKKRGVPKLTTMNIDKLFAEKKIVIESEMNTVECLKQLKSDLSLANIVEVPATIFNAKLTGAMSKKVIIQDERVSAVC